MLYKPLGSGPAEVKSFFFGNISCPEGGDTYHSALPAGVWAAAAADLPGAGQQPGPVQHVASGPRWHSPRLRLRTPKHGPCQFVRRGKGANAFCSGMHGKLVVHSAAANSNKPPLPWFSIWHCFTPLQWQSAQRVLSICTTAWHRANASASIFCVLHSHTCRHVCLLALLAWVHFSKVYRHSPYTFISISFYFSSFWIVLWAEIESHMGMGDQY